LGGFTCGQTGEESNRWFSKRSNSPHTNNRQHTVHLYPKTLLKSMWR